MADGVAITSGTGTTIATDDAGASGHVQIVKLAYSADGSAVAIPADANGLLVNLGSNNDVTVTGTVSAAQQGAWAVTSTIANTVTVDTELPAAAALADDTSNPTVPGVSAFNMVYDGSTWDRLRGTAAGGMLVDLGSNNDVTVTGTVSAAQQGAWAVTSTIANTVTVDTELPAAAALADDTSNPTVPGVSAFNMVYDGSTWDRLRGTAAGGMLVDLGSNNDVTISGDVAHDAGDSGNPVKMGAKAVAHGSNPTAVAAGDRTDLYANRHGIPFSIGGHPNIITRRDNYTSAQTDTAIVTASAGQKIVVTRISVLADKANTVDVAARVGFGAANTPTGAGVVLSHPGIAAGSGVVEGNGSGILGVGADGEDLRITSEVATSGSIDVVTSYFIIES